MSILRDDVRGRVALFVVLMLGGGMMLSSLHAHSLAPPLDYDLAPPGTYPLPVIKAATDGEVLDTSGTSHRLFEYMRGNVVLLSFIYTRCSDARGCPLATGVLYAIDDALRHDPALARHVRLLTLSFDPGHDTPEAMHRYADAVGAQQQSNIWHHLTTASPEALQPLLDGYGQYVVPILDAEGKVTATYSHLLRVFLIDRQQRVRNIYSVDFLHPQVLLNDIKTLLMEDTSARTK